MILLGLFGYSGMSGASLISATTGGVIGAQADVAPGSLESDTIIYAFDENVVTLERNRSMSKVPSGSNNIAAGETVQSHFFHFDPQSDSSVTSNTVTFTFSNEVLGVIWTNSKLDNTDPGSRWEDMGLNGVTYGPGTNRRGLTGSDRNNFQFISPNQISVQLAAGGNDTYDQFRVITAVPLPAAAWLFGSAILGFMAIRRKQTYSITV
ncbi:MAG: VPLPA-CTERM sorting domain-containing protein [Gammaproteobacteria bacterium]|nr:VPLPA-CTERM sorting domain-containing protein [Gammaproteobacteria bacterium]